MLYAMFSKLETVNTFTVLFILYLYYNSKRVVNVSITFALFTCFFVSSIDLSSKLSALRRCNYEIPVIYIVHINPLTKQAGWIVNQA